MSQSSNFWEVMVGRPPGKKYDCVDYQDPTIKHGGGRVKGLEAKGVGLLVQINNKINRAMHKDILQRQLLLYAGGNLNKNWIFQQDNDSQPTCRIVMTWISTKTNHAMMSQSQSPNLNPIKNEWNKQCKSGGVRKYLHFTDFFSKIAQGMK